MLIKLRAQKLLGKKAINKSYAGLNFLLKNCIKYLRTKLHWTRIRTKPWFSRFWITIKDWKWLKEGQNLDPCRKWTKYLLYFSTPAFHLTSLFGCFAQFTIFCCKCTLNMSGKKVLKALQGIFFTLLYPCFTDPFLYDHHSEWKGE